MATMEQLKISNFFFVLYFLFCFCFFVLYFSFGKKLLVQVNPEPSPTKVNIQTGSRHFKNIKVLNVRILGQALKLPAKQTG